MKRAVERITGTLVVLVVVAVVSSLLDGGAPSRGGAGEEALSDGAEAVREGYERWSRGLDGSRDEVVLALGWSKGLSVATSRARGEARLDLEQGRVRVTVDPAGEALGDVWLVDNQPGPEDSVRPEPGDRLLRLGRLSEGAVARLESRPGPSVFADFEVDLVVVTRKGADPMVGGVLFGAPTYFQRLHTRSRRHGLSVLPQVSGPRPPSLLDRLGGVPAHAAAPTVNLPQVVAQGRALFFQETFAGNGRTCGTCHPARNNFALDPAFIATLPPFDPLFVAEFNPDLAENFENPRLMRELGLILENQDGFDDLASRFNMRGVPHTLAMPVSLTAAASPTDGTTRPPNQRTGWSGDGSPGSGTLREFAIGAVTQHFTQTLDRRAGFDFRLPNDAELDALEAFQLSLGRQQDLNLGTLVPKGPLARRGREIFLAGDTQGGTIAAGKCNLCHANAGATFSGAPGGVNFNFDTGVEDLPDHPADFVDPGRRPADGGFGLGPHPRIPGALGNGTFNTPPLVEAADSGPFSHNNVIETIEEAVAFYDSQSFNQSPSGRFLASLDSGAIGIQLEPTQVRAVAAFLRVLNALENIRSAIAFQRTAQGSTLEAARLIGDSLADLRDGIRVLEQARLHPDAVALLKQASSIAQTAVGGSCSQTTRSVFLSQAIALEEAARAALVQ
jgi:hypothetical protein